MAEQTEPEAAPPAVRQPDPTLDRHARVGRWLAASESGEGGQAREMAAALRLYYVEQLGLPPLAASEVSLIRGKLVASARLQRALARRHGFRVAKLDSSAQACTAAVVDAQTGEELGRATFTLDDAKRAGLSRTGSAWTTHPARMLWARAATYAIADTIPEVTLGIVSEDEVAEISGKPAAVDVEPLELDADEPTEADWEAVAAEEAEE